MKLANVRVEIQKRTLIRYVTLGGQRTSIRLDAVYWEALADIARRSGRSVRTVIEEIDRERGSYSRAEAIRVSILQFYRSALRQAGHQRLRTSFVACGNTSV